MANGIGGATPPVLASLGHPYENNAYQLNQGKRLYTWFNCKECHADGGGNIGPALMDGWWRYGPDPASIFATIRDGRPHGMPAFGDKMTTDQIWQLTGYVRTIGAMSASTAAPSRNDDLQSRPAENRTPGGQPAAAAGGLVNRRETGSVLLDFTGCAAARAPAAAAGNRRSTRTGQTRGTCMA